MNDYDDYMDRIRANADARKPLTRAEKKLIVVYLLLLIIVGAIAFATGH